MKTKLFSLFLMLIVGMSVDAQIVFSKFKFTKDSPFGCCPTRKGLDVKMTNTSGKRIKKFTIHYSGVNEIQEAICSDIVGGVNANVKHTKFRSLILTGPLEIGATKSCWTSAVFYSRQKVTAFPREVDIVYMDNSTDTIRVTKENIGKVFPKVKWIDVDYESGFQPSN